ncbi:TetR/AcrR family transcriptional regulator [Gluconobacter roseus]|uniref:Transcriptional regulator n=1 Tax=Gluconobacter roseus NBRC 3990 TaxID=1307950 RepID=A0A4Y3M7C0_9PROT|nr:TetR/AcrR family transcriptional regulator [Gluconobacter roseus]GBR47673.1 TetR family transcriptional regulator [Gluconobacter roseus NBRC 3990]GEB04473.1 transcriptional regulator [Gluconobacter roseus NBRC 3990]GLP92389.1 transcriptional regulator [Gluconobacter roseus NBRC 3990]
MTETLPPSSVGRAVHRTRPGTPRPGIPRQAAEAAILAAAERVFGLHGFRGASVNEIAREAGVPKPNIHYYFGTKEELYCSVLENIMTFWLRDADDWLVPERRAREGFEGYIRAKMAFSRERPDASRIFAYEVLQGAGNIHHYLSTTLREHVARRARTFEVWHRERQMPAIDPVHLMFAIWSMTQAYADMSAQISAVTGHAVLHDSDFEAGLQTILRLVLGFCNDIEDRA